MQVDQPDSGDRTPPAGSIVDPYKVVVLDPGARHRPRTVQPTAYVRDRLLVFGGVSPALHNDLGDALKPLGVSVDRPEPAPPVADRARGGPAAAIIAEHWVSTVELAGQSPATVVDADGALSAVHAAESQLVEQVTLDHTFVSAGGQFGGIGGQFGGIGGQFGGIGGQFGGIGGQFGGIGSPAEFGLPGRGGRMPVHAGLPNPAEHAPVPTRRPVVAIVDSGLGSHPWFDGDNTVQCGADFHGIAIGGANTDLGDGIVDPMTGEMAPLAGHGTFIAGIIRQGCPAARLLCIPVFSAQGFADEGFVHQTLVLLLARHVEALAQGKEDGVIDVLSLSMGYYHERSDDPAAAPALRKLLDAFRDAGVIVVAGVGNDASQRPFFPAAFGGSKNTGDPAVLSVGALNPDGSTVALFSNGGDWVRFYRPGAAVVSTMPITVNGGAEPSTLATSPAHGRRATIDPDGYACGFGVWSGTSFAAPVLAAEAAVKIAAEPDQSLTPAAHLARAAAVRASLLSLP